MVFAIHQLESAIGYICVPPILKPPPTFLPTASLWVVLQHWLWVSYFMCVTFTGHLFYIW